MPKRNDVRTLDDFANEKFGKRGSAERDEIERGFAEFKLGVLIQEARKRKGLTQEQLARRCGTNKAYISRVENGIKDVRLSTLQKIVEIGLEGELELAIKF